MPGISIHVVDVSRGVVAAGMKVELYGPERRLLVSGVTNSKGLLELDQTVPAGAYEAVFHVASWYREQRVSLPGVPFLDEVRYGFGVSEPGQHYHLPFKCTPWGYSCFRGGASTDLEAYLLDWVTLLVRWAHIVVGIAWIGASFYFIWLDDHLEPAKDRAFAGELHAIHGGGFYRAQKYQLAPAELPKTLHWFKWEAYWTWITGFTMLVLVYYLNAELYLVDPVVMKLSSGAAIGIGLGSLVVGLAVYEGLCRSPLGTNEAALAAAILFLCVLAAWGLANVFSGRGAFIHFGAILGTIMAGNVAHVIIPGQRELVRAKQEGREPDPKYGLQGKQRSVHNTYFTLPVIFTMIAGHHPMTFGHAWNWLVLIAVAVAGALVRLWFVARHKGPAPAWTLVVALILVGLVVVMLAPRPPTDARRVSFGEVKQVLDTRCLNCHAEKPSFPGLPEAPKGVKLDTPERIEAQRMQIHQQTVLSRAMPPGNITSMTDEERALLDRWVRLK